MCRSYQIYHTNKERLPHAQRGGNTGDVKNCVTLFITNHHRCRRRRSRRSRRVCFFVVCALVATSNVFAGKQFSLHLFNFLFHTHLFKYYDYGYINKYQIGRYRQLKQVFVFLQRTCLSSSLTCCVNVKYYNFSTNNGKIYNLPLVVGSDNNKVFFFL